MKKVNKKKLINVKRKSIESRIFWMNSKELLQVMP